VAVHLARERVCETVRVCQRVRVFGSRARGDARPDSDLDLLVRFEKGRSLLDLVGTKLALEGLLGVKVDVVSEPGLSRYIRDQVLAEARPLAA
jgi:predicted nucleotidyltransferase